MHLQCLLTLLKLNEKEAFGVYFLDIHYLSKCRMWWLMTRDVVNMGTGVQQN